jgi:hypothetical protein
MPYTIATVAKWVLKLKVVAFIHREEMESFKKRLSNLETDLEKLADEYSEHIRILEDSITSLEKKVEGEDIDLEKESFKAKGYQR